MDKSKLTRIISQISRKFPEFKGIKPLVTERSVKPQIGIYRKLSIAGPKHSKKLTRLEFKKKVLTRDRVKLDRRLIVVLDERGKIIKETTSK